MDHGAYVSREEAENTSFAEALTRYANEITSRKKGARQERDRIEFLKKHASRTARSRASAAPASPPTGTSAWRPASPRSPSTTS